MAISRKPAACSSRVAARTLGQATARRDVHPVAVRWPRLAGTRHLRRSLPGTTALTAVAMLGWLMLPEGALARPTGGVVTQGEAEIIYGETSVTIQQASDRVIIEWESFDVGAHESVIFNQPHALAAALNIVLGGGPTQVLGNIEANGQVLISNPSGVVFGAGANVDVASVVASTLTLMNRDAFMNGDALDFALAEGGDPTAVVENHGTIRASGMAALVGPGARNAGTIVADVTVIGAGEGFALDYYGDGLINFAITAPTTVRPVGSDGQPVEALVVNDGTILSDGGRVILTADAAAGVIDTVINVDGIVQARTIENRDGQVVLLGGDEGTVRVAGTIEATGDDTGEAGGTVHVLGDTVVLAEGADIDVSGQAAGGTALVGGAQGGGPLAAGGHIAYADLPLADGATRITIDTTADFAAERHLPTADIVYVDAGAALAADATEAGDGGTVVVWADDEAAFHGSISAEGGAHGGDGGFAEVSSDQVTVTGTFRLGAVAGQSGSVLIDPTDLCAAAAAGSCSAGFSFVDTATIVATLESGADFTLDTSAVPGSDVGNVEIVDAITVDFANDASADDAATFFVNADAAISLDAAITGTNGALGINYQAVGEIDVNAAVTVGGGADVVMLSQSHIRADASIQNDGTGATSLVAGWDGTTTDIATILATPATYGIGGGAIFIGDGTQTAGIAVGSRYGASRFAAAAMTLRGSDTTNYVYAQAGFRDPGTAGFDIDGTITIALSDGAGTAGNLTATAGSGFVSYVQVGHGGLDTDVSMFDSDGNYRGTITVALANQLAFTGDGQGAYAQLGHGGYFVNGDQSGDIIITSANDLTFGAGGNNYAYAQLGHGGIYARGDHGGAITITSANDLTFSAGSSQYAYAQLGHGGHYAQGDHSGDIEIASANDLTFTGDGSDAYAHLGHGGHSALGDHTGAITITSANDLTFAAGGSRSAYAQLGHGGFWADGDSGGAITIASANDLTLTGGSGDYAYVQLGHGGIAADGSPNGAIDVTVLGVLTLTGQHATERYALIGHGDDIGDSDDNFDDGNTVGGDVTVRVGGAAQLANAFLGHLIDVNGTYTDGDTYFGVDGVLTADASSGFNSATEANGGELRIYLVSAASDAVNAAALLNGVAHGGDPAPNNQGPYAFGLGTYAPGTVRASAPAGGGAVAGNFAYYTLDAVLPPEDDGSSDFPTDVETVMDVGRGIRDAESELSTPGGSALRSNELGAPFQADVFSETFTLVETDGPGVPIRPPAGAAPVDDGAWLQTPTDRTDAWDEEDEIGGVTGPDDLGELNASAGAGDQQAEVETCVAAFLGEVWDAAATCQ